MSWFRSLLTHPVSLGLIQGAGMGLRGHREDMTNQRQQQQQWAQRWALMDREDQMASARISQEQDFRRERDTAGHDRAMEAQGQRQTHEQAMFNQRQVAQLDQSLIGHEMGMSEARVKGEYNLAKENLKIKTEEQRTKEIEKRREGQREFRQEWQDVLMSVNTDEEGRWLQDGQPRDIPPESLGALVEKGNKLKLELYDADGKETPWKKFNDIHLFEREDPPEPSLIGGLMENQRRLERGEEEIPLATPGTGPLANEQPAGLPANVGQPPVGAAPPAATEFTAEDSVLIQQGLQSAGNRMLEEMPAAEEMPANIGAPPASGLPANVGQLPATSRPSMEATMYGAAPPPAAPPLGAQAPATAIQDKEENWVQQAKAALGRGQGQISDSDSQALLELGERYGLSGQSRIFDEFLEQMGAPGLSAPAPQLPTSSARQRARHGLNR